jgi:hypothetical protein
VGTELVFSPFCHPESSGIVERFHQDYNQNTWHKTQFSILSVVRSTSQCFFELYRHSEHLAALDGCCPAAVHIAQPLFQLAEDFALPDPLTLTVGRVDFIRKANTEKKVCILNLDWEASGAQPEQCVWATLEFAVQGAKLRIYDQAPDAVKRKCLGEHPTPLDEPVHPLHKEFQPPILVEPSLFSLATSLFQSAFKKHVPAWLSTMF